MRPLRGRQSRLRFRPGSSHGRQGQTGRPGQRRGRYQGCPARCHHSSIFHASGLPLIYSAIDSAPLNQYDACVVGSGPAGIVFALEMARLGKRTLVLESGGLKADGRQASLSDAQIVDPSKHDDMAIAVSRQLGGTSNLWGGRCQPFDPIDFQARRGRVDAQWPFALSELEPFYQIACRYLSAGNPVFKEDENRLTETAFDVRLERFSNSPAVQKTFWRELSSSQLVDIRLNSTVTSMSYLEDVITDIKVKGPGDTETVVPVKRLIIASGGLESTRQLLILQRKHPGLFGGSDGPLGKYYMGHLIGEISDIVFNEEELAKKFDFFLDGNGSYARRRLIPSDNTQIAENLLNVSFWPVVPPVADARHHSATLSTVCLALGFAPLGRLLVAEAIRKRHIPESIDWRSHIRNVLGGLPETIAYIPWFFYHRYFSAMRLPGFFIKNAGRRYGLSYHCEHSPTAESRIWLSDEADRNSMPKLVIDLRFSRKDAEALLRAHDRLNQWLVDTRLGSIEYRQPFANSVDAILAQASHGTHQIGTARMGTDRHNGVVDRDLLSFDCSNLYVASSAVFPTSGQCNPTLTIAALSARLAQKLARECS